MKQYAFLNDGTKHYDLIYQLAYITGCQSYLELGVNKGSTINLISKVVPRCVGVDICDVKIDASFFLGKTTDFFAQNKETFDIIFIDANHKFEFVKEDFTNSIKILNKYGIVVIHDTDPISNEYLQDTLCSDSYRIVDYIQSLNRFNVFTFPCAETGITLVNRKTDRRVLTYGDNR